MKLLQKISTASIAASAFLAHALPAFADQNVNPCPGTLQGVCATGNLEVGLLVGRVISYLFVIGAVIAVIFLIWGGIKWITSAGDKGKVESARGTIIGAIIGLVIIFASYFIVNLILNAFFGVNLNQLNLPKLVG